MSHETVTIIDRRTDQPVEAVLHTELDAGRLIDAEIEWGPERLRALRRLVAQGAAAQPMPQHVHWNWAMKGLDFLHQLSYRALGIEAEGKMQGLMMVCFTRCHAQLDPDKGKPIVYVDYVETAPWNAKEFTDSPLYKVLGIRLMQAAARISLDEGFSGRVGLHALPQSKTFYAGKCGMRQLGPDPSYQNLEYFELTAAQAAELLSK
jgi:hypothetical protein